VSAPLPETARLILDVLGRRCPAPIIELARHIGEVSVGEVVCVLADDPAAALDIPAWCEMRQQDYLGRATPAGDSPGYLVRRSR
jgi:TusA-related sulfurtransferase